MALVADMLPSVVPGVPPSTNGGLLCHELVRNICENADSKVLPEDLKEMNGVRDGSESFVHTSSDLLASGDEEIPIARMSHDILEIVFDYALNKFDDCRDRLEAGRFKFMSVINKFVRARTRVDMCLPAFPFKSANKVYKAFGFLPDKAEEISLARLHEMCQRIQEIYEPGAKVVIISDGLVYNDLLSISDRHTWFYGQALREMAVEHGFTNIDFSRLRDFVDFNLPETLDEIHYVANATNFRRFILNKFGKDDLDIDYMISVDEDTRLTYQGYRRFLMSDLKHIFTIGGTRTGKAYKQETKYLAKQMLIRGFAFAGAIKTHFPNHLRLSIHQSTGEHKVSMSLLNTKTGFTTPWHCSVALMANGEWMSAPMGDFKENPRMKIVHEKGRPSYFREMTEDEFLQEQILARQSAQLIEKPVTKENHQSKRNETFFLWENVTYDIEVGNKTKRLLDHVDGWLRGGTLTALMGVNGAGKSTLLKILSGHQRRGILHGEISVNGQTRDMSAGNLAGLVYQQDLQFAAATVKEVLILSALLRQPKATPYVEKLGYAEEVIKMIGMETLADTVIGTHDENLNSEQRKRLAIGVELAAKPTTLLLLDQPFSGLDIQAALSICGLLRRLADTGLAVLCALNQPSARIFQSFDRLLLLGKEGKQHYFGKIGPSCKTMTSYFERHGAIACNANENPAEWMLEITQPIADGSLHWLEIWNNSPERNAMRSKLLHLKELFPDRLELIHDVGTSDAFQNHVVEFDAMTIQRIFNHYLPLQNVHIPLASQSSCFSRHWLTNHASAHCSV